MSQNKEILNVLEKCYTTHINRHVRATSLQTLDQMVHSVTHSAAVSSAANANDQ